MKINNVEKNIKVAEEKNEQDFANEFDCEVLFDLSEYLFKTFQCGKNELISLIDEMRNSYVLHRLSGVTPSSWFLKIKSYINEFSSLRRLQNEYNGLIDKKQEILKKLGNNTNSTNQQKIEEDAFASALIERLQVDYEDINLSRNFSKYEARIAQLSDLISQFKENYADLENRFNDSQSDIEQLKGENQQLKEVVEVSKVKSSQIKNKFNETLNRFAKESKAIKFHSAQREKKLMHTINNLNGQVDYWKNEYPKKLLDHFDDEFKKKVKMVNSHFEEQSNKINDFYTDKIEQLRSKDQALFDKYNATIDDYEREKDSLVSVLNTKSSQFMKAEENLQKKVNSMRDKYDKRLSTEKEKIKNLKANFKTKIDKLKEDHKTHFQDKVDRAVKKIIKSQDLSATPIKKTTRAIVTPKMNTSILKDLITEEKSKKTTTAHRTTKNSAIAKVVKNKKHAHAKTSTIDQGEQIINDVLDDNENLKSSSKKVIFDIIGKNKYGIHKRSSFSSKRNLDLSEESDADKILASIRKKTQKK